MRLRLTTLFLLLSYYMQAQFSSNDSRWGITFSPALTSNPTPSFALQPGVEYRLGDRFFLLTDFAFPVITLYRDSLSHRSFFRIKSEARYLFPGWQRRRRGITSFFINSLDITNYIGIQLSYSHRKFRDQNGGSHFVEKSIDTIVVVYDDATIRSPVFTASFQFGALYTIDDNFYIDAFMGVGLRTITSRYSNVINPRVEPHRGHNHDFFPKAYRYPWTVTRPHLNGGVRLIYRFD